MSRSTVLNVIGSAFAPDAAQTAVNSNDIASANTPGYSKESQRAPR
jgi:flagellar hook-associated protein FlgK